MSVIKNLRYENRTKEVFRLVVEDSAYAGNYDIEKAKEVLSSDLIIHKAYQFNTAEIPSSFIQIIEFQGV